MSKLLDALEGDYPHIEFVPSSSFYWSPKTLSVHYVVGELDEVPNAWSLLHELGHALLEHKDYTTDFDLLLLEISAWEKALKIAQNYGYKIDPEHIQDCLDTYRDWLYLRSTCPNCTNCSLQIDSHTYSCLNCNTSWRVSRSRQCRTYRKKQSKASLQTI